MPRPVDHARRQALLDAAVHYVIEHGFAELSWRPVAAALGVSPTTLMHHFGTREQMIQAILDRVRQRILVATVASLEAEPDGSGAAGAVRAVWNWSAAERHGGLFRLFFAVYGLALQQPEVFAPFLATVVSDWLAALEPFVRSRGPGLGATETLVVATVRGLLLDLLTTGDRDRVQCAFDAFVATLEDGAAPLNAAGHGAVS